MLIRRIIEKVGVLSNFVYDQSAVLNAIYFQLQVNMIM